MESPCTAFPCNSADPRENQMVLSSSPTQCLAVTSPSQLEGGNACCGVGTPAPLVMVDAAVNPCPCRPSGTCLDITQQQATALTFHPQRLTMPESTSVYNAGLCGVYSPNFHSDSSSLFTLGCHPTTETFFSSPKISSRLVKQFYNGGQKFQATKFLEVIRKWMGCTKKIDQVPGLETKESINASWRLLPYTPFYYPYDMPGYSLAASYGMDWNGARRKNATRETTSTLKAWLNEHRKNPYPTKGEKIMLAIITKMTLTQVSTWFANARRRLKKENKMTWEPRNICDEDCDADSASDREDCEVEEKKNPTSSESSEKKEVGDNGSSGMFSTSAMSKKYDMQSIDSERNNSLTVFKSADKVETVNTKPRIWSVADMATSPSTNSAGDFSYCSQSYPNADNLDSMSTDLRQQYATFRCWSTDSTRPSSFTRVTPSSISTSLCDSIVMPSHLTRLKAASERYPTSSTSGPLRVPSDSTQTRSLSSELLPVQKTDKEEFPLNPAHS